MSDYISREALKELFDGIYDCADLVFEPDDQICAKQHSSCGSCRWMETKRAIQKRVMSIPAADVLPRDEAIKMGAELAEMHGSDATSQQLEEAYLKGVEDGMTRRDVRPNVPGKWEYIECVVGSIHINFPGCSVCKKTIMIPMGSAKSEFKYCPNCGADMRPEEARR